MGNGGGKGVGAAHGRSNGPATMVGRVISQIMTALGRGKGPGTSNGRGNGLADGRGFGFGHAGVGNRGHNALSGRSSHSQNASHKGGTPDGRSVSNHTHVEHSLAQDHVAHITKADQAVQDDDNGPGKTKASVDPPPPNQELQADHSVTLNPDTIHADPDNVVAIGLQPNQGLRADRSVTLNPDTIHADPGSVVTIGSRPNQEPNVEGGETLNLATIHLGLEDLVTPPLQSNQELQPDSGWVLDPKTIHSELDHTLARALSTGLALNRKSLPPPIVLNTDETPATKYSDRDLLYDISPRILDPTSSELEDDDATGWKLVPLYGVALLFLVATVFSRLGILHVFQWSLHQALGRGIRSVHRVESRSEQSKAADRPHRSSRGWDQSPIGHR